jgi:hypothetical protein
MEFYGYLAVYRQSAATLPFIAFFIFIGTYAIANLVASFVHARSENERRQVRCLSTGWFLVFLILLAYYAMFFVAFDIYRVAVAFLNGSLSVIPAGFTAYAIARYRLFLKAEPEVAREEILETPPIYILEEGSMILVEEHKPKKALEIFADLVKHGEIGLCITRTPTPRIREDFGLERTPILWIGSRAPEFSAEATDNMEEIARASEDFLKWGGSVLFLDGVEYLLSHFDLAAVVKFISQIREIVTRNKSKLIVSIDPRAFTEKEVGYIEEGFEVW